MRRMTPSRLRDRLESRVRKLARTYPKDVQLKAVEEALEMLAHYRLQLLDDLDRTSASSGS
jgi:hypothetical protein